MPQKPTYDELLQKNFDLEQQNKELKQFEAAFKLAEKQRKLEHERFNNILQAIPDGVYIVNNTHPGSP